MKIFPFTSFTVVGNSMLPSLKPNQKVLCFNWAFFLKKPKVGEIISAKVNGKNIIKRVTKIEKDLIFLEGDNKKESTDSRNFGPVQKTQIIGKIVFF